MNSRGWNSILGTLKMEKGTRKKKLYTFLKPLQGEYFLELGGISTLLEIQLNILLQAFIGGQHVLPLLRHQLISRQLQTRDVVFDILRTFRLPSERLLPLWVPMGYYSWALAFRKHLLWRASSVSCCTEAAKFDSFFHAFIYQFISIRSFHIIPTPYLIFFFRLVSSRLQTHTDTQSYGKWVICPPLTQTDAWCQTEQQPDKYDDMQQQQLQQQANFTALYHFSLARP